MKIEHPNFCRQMIAQYSSPPRVLNDFQRSMQPGAIHIAKVAQKFVLPDGGLIHDDLEYRALDETQALRLPYPVIALEFFVSTDKNFPKRILFAIELEDKIVISPILFGADEKEWFSLPILSIPNTEYLDRTIPKQNGRVGIVVYKDDRIPSEETAEAWILLSFLNTLQCNNVHVEKSEPKKVNKKIKTALPFDTYHILTIDTEDGEDKNRVNYGGSHRSPREHLRRGHIRKLPNGKRIFINSTVVNAGRGFGKVIKDYAIV